MKRFAISVALAALFACPLSAQHKSSDLPDSSTLPPTNMQVMKFMEIMQVRRRLESMVQTQQEDMKTTTHNMFNKAMPNATSSQKAKFEDIVAGAFANLLANYPIDDVLRDMIPIYQSHFSESDLNQIVAFYSSPVGQKVLREMPAMSAEGLRVADTRLQQKIDEMMENLNARLKEMEVGDSDRK